MSQKTLDMTTGVQYTEDFRDTSSGLYQYLFAAGLLPALHALNDRVGWISEGALNYVCRRLTVPPAEAYGVATFYAMFSLERRAENVA